MNRKIFLTPTIDLIVIVGVGGTGSYLAQGLAKLIAGYQLEVDVLLIDPDIIEEKNCARQNFLAYEIDQPKSEALAFRLNQQYGVDFAFWNGKGEERIDELRRHNTLFVTCVDTIEARKPYKDAGLWLDLGNGQETGQAIFGNTFGKPLFKLTLETWDSTPTVSVLPNAYRLAKLYQKRAKKNPAPSCADTPFSEQGVFANEWSAAAGLTILHQILVKGEVTTPAIYFDTAKGRMSPAFIDRQYLQQ